MDLNKAIEEMAAEHRRQLTPPCLLLLLTNARRNLNTSSSDDMFGYEDDVDHITVERMSRMFPEIVEFFTLE
jgi:hypothetical protein